MELQHSLPQFEAAHVYVVAISYDPLGTIAQFCDEHAITFDFLADEGSRLIRELGILNTLVQPDEAVYGIPYPGTYLLDEQGVVVAKYFHREYQVREAASYVLSEGFGLPPDLDDFPRAAVEEPHVRLEAQLGAPDLKFRQRVDLYLRLVLPEGVHVNGPSPREGMIPTAVRVTSPADVRAGEPRFPATVAFRPEGAHETIEVLEGEVEVRVELISNEREPEHVPLDVEVEYQACSERECFPPRTARLHLELPVGALNRAQRAT